MAKLRILISALATERLGTGHLRRMATLMAALRDAGEVEIICHTTALGQRILAAGGPSVAEVRLLPAPDDPAVAIAQLADTVVDLRPDVTILDNYIWDATTEARLAPACGFLCVVDDLADRHHWADLLLDQCPTQQASAYAGLVPLGCRLLVGGDYCLIAKPFRQLRAAGVPNPAERLALRPVFLSLGGGDPNRDLLRLTRLILEVTDRPLSIATGSHIADADALVALAEAEPRLRLHLDSTVVARQMNEAGYAVASGGTMTWERAALGLPSLSLVVVDNQVEATRWLAERGYQSSFDLRPGWRDRDFVAALARYDADAELRCAQSAAALTLVTGGGAARTAGAILAAAARARSGLCLPPAP